MVDQDFEAFEANVLKTLGAVKSDFFKSIFNQHEKKREIEGLERELKQNEETKNKVVSSQEKAIAQEDYAYADKLEEELTNLTAKVTID